MGEQPLLLIHSGVGAANEWERVLARMDRDALTPDLPGFGENPIPDEAWSHADGLAALLDAPATVCGASFGGGVALELATLRPDLVARLVLLAPTLFEWEFGPELEAIWAEEERAMEAGDLDAATEANVRAWAPTGDEELVRRNQRRAFELQGADAREPEERPIDLAALTIPVHVLVGDRDKPDFVAIAHHLAEVLPRAELTVLPGAGHLLALERPDAVAAALSH